MHQSSSLPKLRDGLFKEVVEHGYFPTNPDKVRTRYTVIGFVLAFILGLVAFCSFGIFSTFTPLALFAAASVMVFPIGVIILGRYMPLKTHKGSMAAARWVAFKRYLENIDKYTEVKEAQDQFDEYLPYAIAFGLEKSWVGKFAAIDVPVPGWYLMYPVGSVYYGGDRGGRGKGSAVPEEIGGSRTGGGRPSLDRAAGQAYGGLNAMSTGLFTMLNSASNVFVSAPTSSGSGGGGFSVGGGFSGGGGSGGGSSGFG